MHLQGLNPWLHQIFFKIVLAGTGGAVEPGICRFLSFPLINSALGLSATVSPFFISFSVAWLFFVKLG